MCRSLGCFCRSSGIKFLFSLGATLINMEGTIDQITSTAGPLPTTDLNFTCCCWVEVGVDGVTGVEFEEVLSVP